MKRQDCEDRLRLADRYSRAVTDFNVRFEALKRTAPEVSEADWLAVERTRAVSETAWKDLERHIAEHQCLGSGEWKPDPIDTSSLNDILGRAAAAALDAIVVMDDERRLIAVNQAAVTMLGVPRSRILGRPVDEFFLLAGGEAIPTAWEAFIAEGVRAGICEVPGPGRNRRFEYRAKSEFAPGVHLAVLREIQP